MSSTVLTALDLRWRVKSAKTLAFRRVELNIACTHKSLVNANSSASFFRFISQFLPDAKSFLLMSTYVL